MFLLIVFSRYIFGIVSIMVGIQLPCKSIVDCLSSNNSTTVCYLGYCAPCHNAGEPCSNSSHCCSSSRCYRRRCTALYKTGHSCRLHRQCIDMNDFCINRTCTRCLSLWSPCLSDPLSTPCCVGEGICQYGICQSAHIQSETCESTFDCANELICLSGKCQNPFGRC